jgi:signal transduction histidine kinase/DNA-binding response OmpR family regulator
MAEPKSLNDDIDIPSVVLVVDDNEVNRDVLTRRLIRYGHEVETAENGRQALRMIRSKEYDLVLLDIMMPEMNGYEVLQRIKEDPETRNLPVIVISALDDIDSIVKCIQLGAEDYLPKPFNPLLLRARITASLDKKRLRDREQEHLEEQTLAQRIDRELNTRLEIERVAEITLSWAKRRTQPDAILVGLVHPNLLQILIAEGNERELVNNCWPLEAAPLKKAIQSVLPQSTTEPTHFFSPSAKKQIVFPIANAGETIGLLIVESNHEKHFDNTKIAFLSRLSDRAGIALANAQLYQAVQLANSAKSEFIRDVSHELKNPMTSILNYAKMMNSAGPINEDQESFVQIIISNVQRMSRLVSDLSDISRIESGQLHLDIGEVHLPKAIQEVVMSFKGQIEQKKQTLQLQIEENLPPAWGDKDRIQQILTNLLSNAHKYTPEEGHITLSASLNGDGQVHIAVTDNGIGLRPEDQAKIFQKYFRAADERSRTPGTGLGLNITKTLVELQGGQIWFESEFRKGTTFHFTIPVLPHSD